MFENLENLGYVKPIDQPIDLAVEMRTQILRPASGDEVIFKVLLLFFLSRIIFFS
jgi:hypothetical protein